MSFVQQLQQACGFLDALSTGVEDSPFEELGTSFDEAALVDYAVSHGYQIDAASLREAFRLRMAARVAVQNNLKH